MAALRERPTTLTLPILTVAHQGGDLVSRAALGALVDQARAAERHGNSVLDRLADEWDVGIGQGAPTGKAEEIFARFIDRLIGGQMTECGHLSPLRAQPVAWMAARPGRLRCLPCLAATMLSLRGTVEDRTCDGCRRVVKRIRPVVLATSGSVIVPEVPAAMGPVQTHFGLCDRCFATTMTAE